MSSLEPIARNEVWDTLAALSRRLRALESRGGGAGGFQTGDILDSERSHSDFVAGTLSDGGRPGWWLANGATDPNMATTDPVLYAILGNSTVLPDYRGRVRVAPNGTTFASRGTVVGAESSGFSLAEANLPAHVHGAGTLTISPNPHSHTYLETNAAGALAASGAAITAFTQSNPQTAATSLSITGSTASVGSGTAVGVATIQPTRTCGITWIKR